MLCGSASERDCLTPNIFERDAHAHHGHSYPTTSIDNQGKGDFDYACELLLLD